jgi:hypothetical protein
MKVVKLAREKKALFDWIAEKRNNEESERKPRRVI